MNPWTPAVKHVLVHHSANHLVRIMVTAAPANFDRLQRLCTGTRGVRRANLCRLSLIFFFLKYHLKKIYFPEDISGFIIYQLEKNGCHHTLLAFLEVKLSKATNWRLAGSMRSNIANNHMPTLVGFVLISFGLHSYKSLAGFGRENNYVQRYIRV
jgi:hypothetical protein